MFLQPGWHVHRNERSLWYHPRFAEDGVFPFVNPPIGESGIYGTSQAYPTLDVEVLQAAR